MRTLDITYQQVTPESAEIGDFSETGFKHQNIELDSVQDAIDELISGGVTEASSSHFHPGIWYSTEFNTICYKTGTDESESYHLSGFTEAEEKQIYNSVMM